MANVAQATFVGSSIVIECNPEWGCCQREQAKKKCEQANAEIKALAAEGGGAFVRSPAQVKAAKAGLYGPALDDARERITGSPKRGAATRTPAEQADAATKQHNAPKCVGDALKNGTITADDLAMDHCLEVQLGGDAWRATGQTPLLPLDKNVNGAFGTLIDKVKTDMGAGAGVEEIALLCPPSAPGCPAPGPDNSTGKAKTMSTGNPVHTRITGSSFKPY